MELSKKIGEVYKQTKSIKITEDISNLIKEAVKSIPDLPPEMQEDIDELIEKYNSGELNKDEFIDGLSYAEVYEKKNKYVR
jgi:23S rRNA maturation-related 3'-5' exoribonuclease YhaM